MLAVLAAASSAHAGPRWVLIYYRQLGNQINGDRRTLENHLFLENGSKAAGIGVTNKVNAGTPIFGFTDSDGHNRINPLDVNNCGYDIRILQSGVPTDQTPTFYFQNPPHFFYSYVTHWLRVNDDSQIDAYPTQPVYHYDLVGGLNQATGMNTATCTAASFIEAPGANSDGQSLSTMAAYQAQTFVVPAGVNRIISAQAFLARAWDDPRYSFYYKASSHQGGPTGPQVGPAVTSPLHHSHNFREDAVCWGLNDVPVTPGATYALKLVPTDGFPTNVYATTNNNYPGGSLYNGATQMAGRDMVAVITGVGVGLEHNRIVRNPASFTRTVIVGQNLPSDTFTIANGGTGSITYSITDNAAWLSANPTSGTLSGGTDTITLQYNTAAMPLGQFTATITITATNAENSPQVIDVYLTVQGPPRAPVDFDEDGDVDQEDFGRFQSCFSGPGIAQPRPDCKGALLDGDLDVDFDDFGRFQLCMTGPNINANPDCAK